MKKITLVCIWLTVFIPNMFGQSGTRLERFSDSLFKEFSSKTTPGYAITIIRNGAVLLKKDYGMASIEMNVPFRHNTVVAIPYSEGREFISIAATLLEADGKIALEDKVRKYFPKLPAWSEPVTIQDLLNHSSGFCDEWATLVLTQASMNNRFDVSQFLNLLYKQPVPQVEPGKGYMYSNSDFGLLRLILEKASGEKLPDYLQRRVFVPLKMSSSYMRKNKEDVTPNHAFSYGGDGNGNYKVWLRDKTSPGGNYQILTCANDLEKWAAAFADKNSFISKATSRLVENARPIPVLKGTNYVFGQKIKKAGNHEMISHEGATGYAHLLRVASANLSIVCIGNNRTPDAEKLVLLADYILQNGKIAREPLQKFSSAPVAINKDELQLYAGRYRYSRQTFSSSLNIKAYENFRVVNDSLYWVYASDDEFALLPIGKGIFKDPGYPIWIVFERPHPDSVMQAAFHVQTSNPQIEVCKKDTAAAIVYSIQQLEKLTGKYYNSHLDFYFTIELDEKGKLLVKRPTIADKYLEPEADGEFLLLTQYHPDDESKAWLKFYYNELGEPTHFKIYHQRLLECRFDKVR